MYTKLLRELKATLEEHKIENIELLKLKGISPFADYYLLGTAINERQLLTMRDYVEEAAIKANGSLLREDGNGDSGWIVYDCGDVVVHLFLDSVRQEIDLPKLVQRISKKK